MTQVCSSVSVGVVYSVTNNSITLTIDQNGTTSSMTAAVKADTKVSGNVVVGAKVSMTLSSGKAVGIDVQSCLGAA